MLINLDAEEGGVVGRGCQGASLIKVTGNVKNGEGDFSLSEQFRISLSGLPGGHSGLRIPQNRLNAAKAAGEFLESLRLNLPEARVINVRAGKREEEAVSTGTIPAFLEIDVALDSKFEFKLDRISRVAVFDALGLDQPPGPSRRTAPGFVKNRSIGRHSPFRDGQDSSSIARKTFKRVTRRGTGLEWEFSKWGRNVIQSCLF